MLCIFGDNFSSQRASAFFPAFNNLSATQITQTLPPPQAQTQQLSNQEKKNMQENNK